MSSSFPLPGTPLLFFAATRPVSSRIATLCAIFVIGLAVFNAGCRSQEAGANQEVKEDTPFTLGDPITDSTLAVIAVSGSDGDTLTAAEFNGHVQRVMQQFPAFQTDPNQLDELRRTLVEQFVISTALIREAETNGLAIDYARLDEEIAGIKSRFDDEDAFRSALAQENMTESELRERLGEEIQRQQWQEKVVEGVPAPSSTDVESFRQEQAEQVRAQHILFYSPSTNAELQARAEAVLDSVKNGVDFAELARRHSDDGTAEQGGDLDYFSRGEMVEPFANAAFALSDSGDVASEVVRTQFGYHIIRLTGRRTGELMPEDRASQVLHQNRQQEALRDAVDKLRSDVVVRINPDVVKVELNHPEG